MKLNWNFQGGGGLRKNHFCQGGMDIFWSYTSEKNPKYLFQLIEKQIAADNLIVQWLSLEQSHTVVQGKIEKCEQLIPLCMKVHGLWLMAFKSDPCFQKSNLILMLIDVDCCKTSFKTWLSLSKWAVTYGS